MRCQFQIRRNCQNPLTDSGVLLLWLVSLDRGCGEVLCVEKAVAVQTGSEARTEMQDLLRYQLSFVLSVEASGFGKNQFLVYRLVLFILLHLDRHLSFVPHWGSFVLMVVCPIFDTT